MKAFTIFAVVAFALLVLQCISATPAKSPGKGRNDVNVPSGKTVKNSVKKPVKPGKKPVVPVKKNVKFDNSGIQGFEGRTDGDGNMKSRKPGTGGHGRNGLSQADPNNKLGKIIKGVTPSKIGKVIHGLNSDDIGDLVKSLDSKQNSELVKSLYKHVTKTAKRPVVPVKKNVKSDNSDSLLFEGALIGRTDGEGGHKKSRKPVTGHNLKSIVRSLDPQTLGKIIKGISPSELGKAIKGLNSDDIGDLVKGLNFESNSQSH